MKSKNTNDLQETIRSIIDIARLAPSVHNTQAWLVTYIDNGVIVRADARYSLHDGDPTGRQTVISLGVFCEAIRLVSIDKHLQADIGVFVSNGTTITFKDVSGRRLTTQSSEKLLSTRCTDRSIYSPATISQKQIQLLKNASKGLNAKIHIINNTVQIATIANLTSHGIALALSNPDFRKELSKFLLVPWSKRKRGISVSSLYIPTVIAWFEPLLMSLGIGMPLEVKLEKKRWESASAIIAITAPGDLAKYWFEVGRAYLRLSLIIEDLGLSQATSGAIVEASNYHDDVEAMIHTKQRILAMVRIGKGSNKRRYSPRVTIDEITA